MHRHTAHLPHTFSDSRPSLLENVERQHSTVSEAFESHNTLIFLSELCTNRTVNAGIEHLAMSNNACTGECAPAVSMSTCLRMYRHALACLHVGDGQACTTHGYMYTYRHAHTFCVHTCVCTYMHENKNTHMIKSTNVRANIMYTYRYIHTC